MCPEVIYERLIRVSHTGEQSSHGLVAQLLASWAIPDSTEGAVVAERGANVSAGEASRFRSVVLRGQLRGWQGEAEATSQVTFSVAWTQLRPCCCSLSSSTHS